MSESRAGYFREYRAKRAASPKRGFGLLPSLPSRRLCRAVCRKENPVDIAALSVPRGEWKDRGLCGKIVARSITPGDLTIR